LQTRQRGLSFGHRQPQIGEIAETVRTGDPHDVDPLLLTIGPDFYQPHSPSHASTLHKPSRGIIPISKSTLNRVTAPTTGASSATVDECDDHDHRRHGQFSGEPLDEQIKPVADALAPTGCYEWFLGLRFGQKFSLNRSP
jgi:hypothetical protein